MAGLSLLSVIIGTGLLAGIPSPQALAHQPAPQPVSQPANGLQVDLSHLFNNDGIATNDDPTDGNLDGSGYSYPAEHMPASGVVKIGGITFNFPGSRPKEKNNVVAEGQRIDVPAGRYHAASLLLASTYGAASSELTFHYDDGTTTSSRFEVADWYSGPLGTLTIPFRYTSGGGKDEHPVFLRGIRLSLDSRRNLVGISVPQAPETQQRLHVFALTLHQVVRGIYLEFFDLLERPRITTEEAGRHAVQLNIQNLGTTWISGSQKVRIVIEAPGIATISPARIKSLAPGEVFQAEVHLETQLPRGTEVTGEVKVTGRSGIRESMSIKLLLGASDYTAAPASLARHPSPTWYENAKFGIFIHWGIYAVPAWAPVAGVFAEWYWQSMNSSASPTYDYHRQTYGTAFGYDDFIPQFQPSQFDPKEWVELIRESGARYFVFTAKHHDGFALYDSSTTDRDSVALGPHRDFVRELFLAAETQAPELKRGVYYSLFEWYHPAGTGSPPVNPYTHQPVSYTGALPVNDFVVDHVLPQMREVIDGYDPDIVWCDVEPGEGAEYWKTAGTIAHFYNQAKNRARPKEVAINDRCSVTNPQRSPYGADFVTIEYDTYRTTIQKKWEMTRGLDPHSFGFNAQTPEGEYLTANEAIDLLSDVVSKNGNLLLNIGPASDGSIPAVMRNSLLEIGTWLATNGEAIYGTTYWWRTPEEGNLRFTVKRNEAFYVIALEWPGEELIINSPIPIRGGYTVQLLGDSDRQLKWFQRAGKLIISLPPDAQSASRHAWVFRIR